MKRITGKQFIPIFGALFSLIFMIVGFLKLGFWSDIDGPMPGFFPAIMAVVMFIASILALLQSFREDKDVNYNKGELLVIGAGISIFVSSFIIGLLPTIFIYTVLWLKLFEKENWKNVFIVLIVIAIIAIGVFNLWLGVQFPVGLFEYIL